MQLLFTYLTVSRPSKVVKFRDILLSIFTATSQGKKRERKAKAVVLGSCMALARLPLKTTLRCLPIAMQFARFHSAISFAKIRDLRLTERRSKQDGGKAYSNHRFHARALSVAQLGYGSWRLASQFCKLA